MPDSNITEHDFSQAIVKRIEIGDGNAESEMVLRYQRGLLAMLYQRSQNKALAEDIAQDTWALVIKKLRAGDLRDKSKLAAYIVQIGKNQLIMHFRKKSSKDDSAEESVLSNIRDTQPTPEQYEMSRQCGNSIVEVMKSLSRERDREILSRFYLIGDSKTKLCLEYSLSEAHFDRVLYRARERFKLVWERQELAVNQT